MLWNSFNFGGGWATWTITVTLLNGLRLKTWPKKMEYIRPIFDYCPAARSNRINDLFVEGPNWIPLYWHDCLGWPCNNMNCVRASIVTPRWRISIAKINKLPRQEAALNILQTVGNLGSSQPQSVWSTNQHNFHLESRVYTNFRRLTSDRTTSA